MQIIEPLPLKVGDVIGLVTPSSPVTPTRVPVGIAYLEKKGFKVKLGKNIDKADRFLAGTDQERAADVMDFFKDPNVHGIMAMCGGQGSQRILPLLDYDYIRTHPKVVLGFSDTTALSLGLFSAAGLVSYSGFTFRDADTLTGTVEPLIERTLTACLAGQSYQIHEGVTINPGIVQAPLIGGTLTLIANLMGTPYQPDFKGKILFFEEVWSEPFAIDGMLANLYLAGVFAQVAGIIIGQFEQCVSKMDPKDGTVEQVLADWCKKITVPCIKDFPYGHGQRRGVLPIGKTVILDATTGILSI